MTLYFKCTSTAKGVTDHTGEEDVRKIKRKIQKNHNKALAIKMISKMASIPTAVVVTDATISSVPTMSRVHTGKVLTAAQVTNKTTVKKAAKGSKEVRRRWNRIQFDVQRNSPLAIGSGSVAAKHHATDHGADHGADHAADHGADHSADHEEHHTGTCGYHKQNWNEVDHVAWVLLLTIAIECLIEGIAFSLALQDSFGAGVAVFLAMLIKLVPQKMGHVGFLLSAGLNHFWENLLALLAVMMIYIGIILGLAIENELREIKYYFFGALSGIFLYMSLASLFPVLQEAIEDHTVDPEDEEIDLDLEKKEQKLRHRLLIRLILANLGFIIALAIVLPVIYYEHDLQLALQKWICTLLE